MRRKDLISLIKIDEYLSSSENTFNKSNKNSSKTIRHKQMAEGNTKEKYV